MDREMLKTMIFMLFMVVIVFLIFSTAGVLDKRSEDIMSRAEFICWQNGYLNGVDQATEKNDTMYFSCKGEKINIVIEGNNGTACGRIE